MNPKGILLAVLALLSGAPSAVISEKIAIEQRSAHDESTLDYIDNHEGQSSSSRMNPNRRPQRFLRSGNGNHAAAGVRGAAVGNESPFDIEGIDIDEYDEYDEYDSELPNGPNTERRLKVGKFWKAFKKADAYYDGYYSKSHKYSKSYKSKAYYDGYYSKSYKSGSYKYPKKYYVPYNPLPPTMAPPPPVTTTSNRLSYVALNQRLPRYTAREINLFPNTNGGVLPQSRPIVNLPMTTSDGSIAPTDAPGGDDSEGTTPGGGGSEGTTGPTSTFAPTDGTGSPTPAPTKTFSPTEGDTEDPTFFPTETDAPTDTFEPTESA